MSTVISAVRSTAEAAAVSRTIDYLLLFSLFFILLGGYHIHAMLTMGDWDFWTDWKDRRLWVTVTPIMLITFPAAVQVMLWEKFRLPFGATFVVLGLLFGEWVNRYFNFWGWTYFPMNFVWPATVVPSALALDIILLLSRSYLITALVGGLAFSLFFYPSNWPMLAGFHLPVDYYGTVMSLADIQGYHYVRTGTPEYIRMVEKGTLRTFGKDVAPVSAFFFGFICILMYTLWHFIGRWFSTTRRFDGGFPAGFYPATQPITLSEKDLKELKSAHVSGVREGDLIIGFISIVILVLICFVLFRLFIPIINRWPIVWAFGIGSFVVAMGIHIGLARGVFRRIKEATLFWRSEAIVRFMALFIIVFPPVVAIFVYFLLTRATNTQQ
jgi:methane/ammonia monooxygenase subunit A